MRRNLTVLVALFVALAIAVPASAAIEFKWGGQFRYRWVADNNVTDGSDSVDLGYEQVFSTVATRIPDFGFHSVNLPYREDPRYVLPGTERYRTWNDDNTNFVDQRIRLYMTFQASENLKGVVKLEMGDTYWGRAAGRLGAGSGGGIGADGVSVEVKNAYLDFAIPCTPTRATVGIQGARLLSGWIFDDDFAGIMLTTKLDPFKILVGYISGQNTTDWTNTNNGGSGFADYRDNVDDWLLALDYKCGPWALNLTGLYQSAHQVPASVYPPSLVTPSVTYWPGTGGTEVNPTFNFREFGYVKPTGGAWSPVTGQPNGVYALSGVVDDLYLMISPISAGTVVDAVTLADSGSCFNYFDRPLYNVSGNNLFDLGFSIEYKIDWLRAYVNFVKNLGSVELSTQDYVAVRGDRSDPDILDPQPYRNSVPVVDGVIYGGNKALKSHDYTGWMVDAGVYYYCGPWTLNIGGFYTSGPEMKTYTLPVAISSGVTVGGKEVYFDSLYDISWKAVDINDDISWFTYPHAGPSKQTSEIMGGAVFDTGNFPGSYGYDGANFYRGYPAPTNVWTITAGAAWQAMPKTKLYLSYWYWGTSTPVMSEAQIATVDYYGFPRDIVIGQKFARCIGNEIDLGLTQGIWDGLNLDVVFAYMLTGDAYANSWNGSFLNPVNYEKDDAWKFGARLQWDF